MRSRAERIRACAWGVTDKGVTEIEPLGRGTIEGEEEVGEVDVDVDVDGDVEVDGDDDASERSRGPGDETRGGDGVTIGETYR